MGIPRTTNRAEEREQARLVAWTHKPQVRALAPALAWLFHVPNGGKRDAFTGAQMKALGVKRGVPDLWLPIPSGPHTGLVIEMKAETGALSPEQSQWFAMLTASHWRCHIARTAEQGVIILAGYLDAPMLLEIKP